MKTLSFAAFVHLLQNKDPHLAKNKARTATLHPRTQKLLREVCKHWFLLLCSWGIVSKEMGTNPFWLEDSFQEGCGEAEHFYSEPHLKRSPAHCCFPRPCFNFSGMMGWEGLAMELSFPGGCCLASWHPQLSASRGHTKMPKCCGLCC